jgi:pyochelin biosynthetic protein PchC
MTTAGSKRDLWLRRSVPSAPRSPQLICCPHAGGSASFYRPVALAMSPQVDVCSVQYPGRQDRRLEPGVDSIETLADQIFEALHPIDVPFALLGHSMGAVVAFELARRLEAVKNPPAALFVSGRRGPRLQKAGRVHLRDDRGLIEEIRSLSGTDQALLQDEEILAMILPVLRSDYRAIETYRPASGEPLSCPIVALIGASDPQVTVDEAQFWAAESTGPFALEVHPGDHFYLSQRGAVVNAQVMGYLRRFIPELETADVSPGARR